MDIIKSANLFFKDNKFSRTEYEKFLLKSNLTAPTFEQNIVQQESRRQFLSSLAGGITIPDILIENEFKKENQIKTIKYIDLNEYHASKKPTQEEIKELYDKNKSAFVDEFKSIQFAEITPQILSGNNEYDKAFFKQLDILENKVLDGQSFEESSNENNLKIVSIESINKEKKDKNDKEIKDLSDNLFKKIYKIAKEKSPEILKVDSKYFLAEIKFIEKKNRSINDPDVLKLINAQINFKIK